MHLVPEGGASKNKYFGEISTGHAICAVSSDTERNIDIECKAPLQDLKKLNLGTKDQKLLQILFRSVLCLLILCHEIKKQHACTSCEKQL